MTGQTVLCICGVKNSGKTTLIESMLPYIRKQGRTVAVIKHDGHDFEADVPGTDTYRHLHAGACGTVCYSDSKYMLVHAQPGLTSEMLCAEFPEADLILIEGGKHSTWPKLELVREGNSERPVCTDPIAIVTDQRAPSGILPSIPILDLNDPEQVADFLLAYSDTVAEAPAFRCKTKLVLSDDDDDFFGPGIANLMRLIEETGSIRRAATDMGLSYSKAWKLIGRAERGTGIVLLERTSGGRMGGNSQLTPNGRDLLDRYDAMLAALRRYSDTLFSQYMKDLTGIRPMK